MKLREKPMTDLMPIERHAEVIEADGLHVETVDHVEDSAI